MQTDQTPIDPHTSVMPQALEEIPGPLKKWSSSGLSLEFRGWSFDIFPTWKTAGSDGPLEGVVIVDNGYFLTKIIVPNEAQFPGLMPFVLGRLEYSIINEDGPTTQIPRWQLPQHLYAMFVEQVGGWELFTEIFDAPGAVVL